MRIYIYFIFVSLLIVSCNESHNKNSYPETKKIPVTDIYFDESVTDDYRWLEDDNSDDTKKWVINQNNTTFKYLDEIPFRNDLKVRLEQLWDYEKISAPFKEGQYTYFYKNDGLQNQSILYREINKNNAEVFLDPNSFSKDGTTSLSTLSFSKTGDLVAYSISEGGSDWRKIIVMNATNKKIIGDTLVDVKFSGIQWKLDEGFFYSSYDKPKGSELSDMTDQHKLYYHKLGTKQSEDILVYGGEQDQKHRYVGAKVSDNGKYLFISASKTTSGNISFLKDLNLNLKTSPLIRVDENYQTDSYLLHSDGERLYIVTNSKAPNQKLIVVNARKPQEKYWKDFIPEGKYVLSPTVGGGYFFARYIADVITKVIQYDMDGVNMGEIELPGLGTASGWSGKKDQEVLYFSFTNYHSPSQI